MVSASGKEIDEVVECLLFSVVAFQLQRDHVEAEAFECCEVEFCLFRVVDSRSEIATEVVRRFVSGCA